MKKIICVLLAVATVVMTCATVSAAVFTPTASYKSGKYYTQLCNVTATGDLRRDIANVALSQVGYHEGNSSSEIDGTSTGNGNYTQYGADYGIPSDAWCATFVWWCARQAGVGPSIIHKTEWAKTLCFGLPFDTLKNSGSIRVGDIVFFDNSGSDSLEDHVGLVVDVTSDKITTVEGNYNNCVVKRTYDRSTGKGTDGSGKILYIGFPDYESGNRDFTYSTLYAVVGSDKKCYSAVNGSENGKTVKKGEYLIIAKIISGSQTWYQVANGLNGYYIKGSDIEEKTVELPPVSGCDPTTVKDEIFQRVADTTPAATKKLTTKSTVNVRKGAGTKYAKVTSVKKGKTYTYTSTKKAGGYTWYYIKVSSSKSGWVCGKYVTVKKTSSSSSSKKIAVTSKTANVRKGAGTSYAKITTVKKGAKYTYTSTKKVGSNTWYYIKISSSKSGWICSTCVKKA